MKKALFILLLVIIAAGSAVYYSLQPEPYLYLYIHVQQNQTIPNTLKEAFSAIGKPAKTVLTNHHTSGRFNLYIADNLSELPEVKDNSAINILWLPFVAENDNPEVLRPFDVIAVKSPAAFRHLKAINVRTAYIPDAIETPKVTKTSGKVLLWRNDNDSSLVDTLVKKYKLDINTISTPTTSDFQNSLVVLLEQNTQDLQQETISEQIRQILAHGGLPFIVYNNGVARLFGDIVPMYRNEQEFIGGLRFLMNKPAEVQARKDRLRQIIPQWNSRSAAQKFVEIFEITEKKRR